MLCQGLFYKHRCCNCNFSNGSNTATTNKSNVNIMVRGVTRLVSGFLKIRGGWPFTPLDRLLMRFALAALIHDAIHLLSS